MWPGAQLSSLPERHAQAFAAVQALNMKVGRAWAAIKEVLQHVVDVLPGGRRLASSAAGTAGPGGGSGY